MAWFVYGRYNTGSLTMGLPDDGGKSKIIVTSVLRDRTPAEAEDPLEEAQVVWGQPSNFSWGNTSRNFSNGPYIRTSTGGVLDPDEEENEDITPVTDIWEEVARVERDVRIDGPNGAYVDFKRVDEVTFRLPDLPGGIPHFVVQRFKKFGDEDDSTPTTTV